MFTVFAKSNCNFKRVKTVGESGATDSRAAETFAYGSVWAQKWPSGDEKKPGKYHHNLEKNNFSGSSYVLRGRKGRGPKKPNERVNFNKSWSTFRK